MDSIRQFIEPIKKKWIYHFIISPKTNSIERPEWYFGTTRKWIEENIDKIETKVSKSQHMTDSSICCSNVKHMFVLCMVELIMKRLTEDMEKVTTRLVDNQSETILIQTYNEAICFTKFLRQTLGLKCFMKLHDKYDILAVYSNQVLFEKIVDVEWEYAEKNLKTITSSPNILDPVLDGDFVDEYKIPICADRLLLLVTSITERVECFRQPDCQFTLVELQCSLFDKFLKFLKRLVESNPRDIGLISNFIPFTYNSPSIDLSRVLNALNFIKLVLKEKSFVPAYLVDMLETTLTEKITKLVLDYANMVVMIESSLETSS